ncbi:MAG: SRPBCC family protein [Chloroflexota bacterium]
MIKLGASVCIEAPANSVWARLAKLEDIELWAEPVLHARCEGALAQGVGAERICELTGRQTITERWVAWEEGRSFTYEGFGIPLMKRAVNSWSVLPQGEKTLLTSEAELEVKGGTLGRILEPIIAPVMRRMAPHTLAAFKYLVEHGHPYDGEAADLPLAPANC